MKFFLSALAVTFMASTSFAESRSVCKIELAQAQVDLDEATARFGSGEITRTDVEGANFDLLNLRLTCNTILIDDYCASAAVSADLILQGTTEEYRVGQRTREDLKRAHDGINTVLSRCN